MKNKIINPEKYSSFYSKDNLGLDIQLIKKGFEIFSEFFKGNNCLELGCGDGTMTRLLAEYFDKLTVVEGSKTLINNLPIIGNLNCIHSLFEEFSPEEQYDTIIMNHVLEHIDDPVRLLSKIKTWLSSNGNLIIGVPNSESFHRIAAVEMGILEKTNTLNERDIKLGHKRVYDFKLLKNHVLSAGFKIINQGGIFLKFLSNNQIESTMDSNVVNAYFKLGSKFPDNSAEIFLVLKNKND